MQLTLSSTLLSLQLLRHIYLHQWLMAEVQYLIGGLEEIESMKLMSQRWDIQVHCNKIIKNRLCKLNFQLKDVSKIVDTWDIYVFNLILNSRNEKRSMTHKNLSWYTEIKYELFNGKIQENKNLSWKNNYYAPYQSYDNLWCIQIMEVGWAGWIRIIPARHSIKLCQKNHIRGCHMVDVGHKSCFFNLNFCFLVFFSWMNYL